MISKESKKELIKVVIVLAIAGLAISMIIDIPKKIFDIPKNTEEKVLFPKIIGDTILENNETGKGVITSIALYDNFKGYLVKGHRANYSSRNGTMIIFVAQMLDNNSANRSLKDMLVRAGYDDNIGYGRDRDIGNNTVVKLKDNPEIYLMQKNRNISRHYTFAKSDKVYWVGFSSPNTRYQIDMLTEIYRNVDDI